MLHRIPSIAKIKALIRWEPRRGLQRVLEDLVEDQRAGTFLPAS